MKNTTRTLKFLAVLVIFGSMGCGQNGFQTGTGLSNPDNQSSQSVPSQEDIPASVDVSSFIDSGTYAKLQTVEVDRSSKNLLLRMPLGPNIFIGVTSGDLSTKYPGIRFTTEMDTDGTAYIVLTVPLKYVLRGVTGLNPQRLPNGDALPMIPSGELPGLAFTLNGQNKVKLYVYLAADTVALYVESPFNPYIGLTVPIKNQAKTKYVGYFSSVPAKTGFQGGFFMSYIMPPEITAVLDKYIFP